MYETAQTIYVLIMVASAFALSIRAVYEIIKELRQ